MISLAGLVLPIAGTLLVYALFHALQILYHEVTSPLRHMAGPRNPSFLFGNFRQMAKDPRLADKWRAEFGANFRFRSLFSVSELHTSDLKALNYILTNGTMYQVSSVALAVRKNLFGTSLLSVETDDHKRLNAAFGVPQIRLLTETFVEKAVHLRDIWAQQVAEDGGTSTIDVSIWLRRMTLDAIGQAGFNYDFEALQKDAPPNELSEAFTALVHTPRSQRNAGFRIAREMVPILRLLPLPGMAPVWNARTQMERIGSKIVAKSKAEIKAAHGELKAFGGKRDLLSILLKANMAPDVPESYRLNDAEVLGQIPTFFFAGHETTSTAVSWALHALSINIPAQTKLREELFTIATENPTMEELNSLPYLENVVRELLRVHSPIVSAQRQAMQDDVVPLSKPYVDSHGKEHDSLVIPKGQIIHIPILAVNTDKEIWGPDAAEFKPERWDNIPAAASAIPGVWANLLTFLAGPRNCIGFRFSLVETKALLFVLLRTLEFENVEKIRPSASILQFPTVVDKPEQGSSLPMLVKIHHAEA
ncbi:cytochrome P450 [Mycena pura]|uniref:Cytochrome P450 n=1 Tax=Mycena pura TaxID=153505 RepID=A0AAD6YUX9_9AGAR|nr:cytochrome P450 [Mycena pura]